MEPPLTGLTADELLEQDRFIRALARSLLGDDPLADDVTQQTWLAALERPPKDRRAWRSWLRVVARHFAIKLRDSERRVRRRERDAARPEAVESAESIASRLELQRALVQAVLALEEPYRSTVLLRFYGQQSPRQIAERQGVPVDTVQTRLRRALLRLRDRLGPRWGGPAGRNRCLSVLAGGMWGAGESSAFLAMGSSTKAAVHSFFLGGLMTLTKKLAIAGIAAAVLGGVWWTIGSLERPERIGVEGAEIVAPDPRPLGEALREQASARLEPVPRERGDAPTERDQSDEGGPPTLEEDAKQQAGEESSDSDRVAEFLAGLDNSRHFKSYAPESKELRNSRLLNPDQLELTEEEQDLLARELGASWQELSKLHGAYMTACRWALEDKEARQDWTVLERNPGGVITMKAPNPQSREEEFQMTTFVKEGLGVLVRVNPGDYPHEVDPKRDAFFTAHDDYFYAAAEVFRRIGRERRLAER